MRVEIEKNGNIIIFDFSPVQAFKVAVHMEEDGIRFYEDLAKKVKDEEAGREIRFLIQEEKEHLQAFRQCLDAVKSGTDDAFEEDDIVQYISSKVFDVSEELREASRMDHRHTALEEALNMERRSIVFYEASLSRVSDPQARGAFAKILSEERGHLKKFGELLRIKCINSQKGCLL
jgi:rubrerythrin